MGVLRVEKIQWVIFVFLISWPTFGAGSKNLKGAVKKEIKEAKAENVLHSIKLEGDYFIEQIPSKAEIKNGLIGFRFSSKIAPSEGIENQDSLKVIRGPIFNFYTSQVEADLHFKGMSEVRISALVVEGEGGHLEATQMILFKKSQIYGEVPITLISRSITQEQTKIGLSGSILDMHLPSSDYVVF